jgi:hypothetical protein
MLTRAELTTVTAATGGTIIVQNLDHGTKIKETLVGD